MYVISHSGRVIGGCRAMLDAVDFALDLSREVDGEVSARGPGGRFAGFTDGKRTYPQKYSDETLATWADNMRTARKAKAVAAHAG